MKTGRTESEVLQSEALRAERIIAWMRLASVVVQGGADVLIVAGGLRVYRSELPAWTLAADLGMLAFALGAWLWLRRPAVHRGFKFVVATFDTALITFVTLAVFGPTGVDADTLTYTVATGVMLVVFVSALRFSVAAAVYSTAVAVLAAGLCGAWLHASPSTYVYSVIILITPGLIAGYTSHRHRKALRMVVERQRLERFLPREVVEELVAAPDELVLGGRETTVTVLFSDIRGFTSISEHLEAGELVGMLNEYLSVMTEVVFRHLGTLDKFVGDAVMAVFGAPIRRPDDAARAVRCAVDMRRALVALSDERARRGLPVFRMGIGLHTGQVVAGTIGSAERMEYTVIGDTVNVAARVESMTRRFEADILVTRATAEAVDGGMGLRRVAEVELRGRAEPVELYAVDGEADSAERVEQFTASG